MGSPERGLKRGRKAEAVEWGSRRAGGSAETFKELSGGEFENPKREAMELALADLEETAETEL